MEINDLKIKLENIIHSLLYTSSILSDQQEKDLQDIKNYLKNHDQVIENIRTLISTRTNENYFMYDKYIKDFLVDADIEIKKELLNNQDIYEDLCKSENTVIEVWRSFSDDIKIDYLVNKKKYTPLDVTLINEAINSGTFNNNVILEEILHNKEIRKKIPLNSLCLNYCYSNLGIINLCDEDVCSILTQNSYTKLLLKKCKKFEEFKAIYEDNKYIYNLIAKNSLIFNNEDNEQIYQFILDNPNFIGKFNNKYLDLFSIIEIKEISNNKNLDQEAFSAIIQKLYKYDESKADDLFNEENLMNCPKHSILVYPFENMSKDLETKIFSTYTLFNRFIDTIMIEAINNKFQEDDILNNLRNDTFINETSSYAIELLINKLSFKAAFNMLQRKVIFDKITNLHIKIDSKDALFVKGFLDSPILVYKSEHNMIYEMLKLLDEKDFMYYIALPYIINNLSNYELVNLCLDKKIKINKILENNEIFNTLNTTDIISYIDRYFEYKIDLTIFKNKKITTEIFNITDEQFDNIDFDEVNYLFETIRMKSLLSKQEFKSSVLSYKNTLISYLILGLDETLKLVNEGNMGVTLDEVRELQKDIVNERTLLFKENNSAIFQNIAKKIINNLQSIEATDDINSFASEVRKNTYLDNILYIMLDNNFDTYNSIIDNFYDYLKYSIYDKYQAKKNIYDYTNSFVALYINNKAEEYNQWFNKLILKNFKPKENILYSKRKELGNKFLNNLKFKLFVRALTDPNKESYQQYFKDNYPITEIKEHYIKYLSNTKVDFDSIIEHVLLPISNERFDKENCLNKLGIKMPQNAMAYLKYLDDLQNIDKINNKINKIRKDYDKKQLDNILNYICYDSEITFKISKTVMKQIDKLKDMVALINGEIYIDNKKGILIYKNNIDIYNEDEIIAYKKYIEILDNIINKTYTYIKNNMDTEKIQTYFARDYYKALEIEDYEFPITNKYYELKKRVFSLKDIETIFNGYDLSNYKKIDEQLKKFLIDNKNIIMVAEGYYEGIVDNLGVIIFNWDKIIDYAQKLKMDINNLTLIKAENILTLINFENNPLAKIIDKEIIKATYEDGYYEILDLNIRINILIDLFKNAYKRVKSSIPYLEYIENDYKIKVLDSYNQDTFKSIKNTLYKVGAIGNDFLHYSILDKNGIQVGIYKNNQLVAKILGVRNGNTLYLNALEGIKDIAYNDILRNFAMKLVSITKDDVEPIEFVTIVNNDIYQSRNGLNVDSTICPIINDPINKSYLDYKEFAKNENLLNPYELYTNYEDNISTLLTSSIVVDKNNFKYYDADSKYYRKREDVIKLSNNIGEEYLNRIDAIMYLWQLENQDVMQEDIVLNMMKTIYLGDDFVLFITEKNNYIKFVLPYDERASKEVDLIVKEIEKI